MIYNRNLQLKMLWCFDRDKKRRYQDVAAEFSTIDPQTLLVNFNYLVDMGYIIKAPFRETGYEHHEEYIIHASGTRQLYPEYFL